MIISSIKNAVKIKIKKPLTSTLGTSKSRIKKNKRRERVKNLIKGRPTTVTVTKSTATITKPTVTVTKPTATITKPTATITRPDVTPLLTPPVQEIRNARKQIFLTSDPVEEMELEDNAMDDDVEIIPEITDINPNYNVKDDYLLGSKTESTVEMLVVNLRLHSLIKPLRDGIQLCKNPSKYETTNVYPTLNIVHQINGFENAAMNPVFWSTDQVYLFIKHIATVKNLAKTFRLEDIDGAALMNLSKSDLMKYMQLNSTVAGSLSETIKNLRNETIQKFLNVKAYVFAK